MEFHLFSDTYNYCLKLNLYFTVKESNSLHCLLFILSVIVLKILSENSIKNSALVKINK